MRLKQVSFALGMVLILSLLFPPQMGWAQAGQAPARQSPVSRYIQAIQKRDFKTIIDLTYSYQQEVAKIKANNPQVLWPKLIGEYQQKRISALSQQAGYWQSYGESLGAMTGDPTQTIRALQGLIPALCKWKITESRTDFVQDSIAYGRYQRTRVYVTIDYITPAESPIVDQTLLKETIVEFTFNAKTQHIMGASRLPKADVYWTGGPDVRVAMAKRFGEAGKWDAAISQLQPLELQNQLSPEGKDVLASIYYQRVLGKCFATGSNPNAAGFPNVTWLIDNQNCQEDIRRAVRLKPSLGKAWANHLLNISKQDLQASDPDKAASFVRMASRFTAGDADLETRVTAARKAVGQYYLAMADQLVKGWGFSEAEPSLKSAIDIWPGESRKRALEVAKGYISSCMGDKYGGRAAFDVLESMKNLGVSIPAAEVPQFMQFAERLPAEIYAGPRNPPAEWRKRVRELAAGPAAAPSPTIAGAAPVVKSTATEASPSPISRTFALEAFGKREVVQFSLTQPGKVVLEAVWGEGIELALILNGPGQVNYYARKDGYTPLRLEYQVTAQDLAKGDEWRASIVNFSRAGSATGSLRVTIPASRRLIGPASASASGPSDSSKASYRRMDFGFNRCAVQFGELKTGVSEADMVGLAAAANAKGFTYHPSLGYGKLIIGDYPEGCRSPAGESWPLYLKVD